MFSTHSQIYQSLVLIGAPQNNPFLYKRVVFANRATLLLIATSLVWALILWAVGWYEIGSVIFCSILFYAPILFMNSRGWHQTAAYLTVIIPSLVGLGYSLLLGWDTGLQYMLVPVAMFPILLFSRDDYFGIAFGSSLPVLCFFFFVWLTRTGYAPEPYFVTPIWSYYVCMLTCFVVSGFLYRHFYTILSESQEFIQRTLEERVSESELQLRRANERYEAAAKATNESIYEWDMLSNTLEWNDNFYQTFGYQRNSAINTIEGWAEGIHPDDREKAAVGLDKIIAQGGSYWTEEYRMRKTNGEYAYIMDRGYIFRDADGVPYRMVGSMLDQTHHKKVEEEIRALNDQLENRVRERTNELKKSYEKLEAEIEERKKTEIALKETSAQLTELAANIDGILWVTSINGDTVHYVNPAIEKIFGYSAEDFYRNPMLWAEYVLPEDRPQALDAFRNAVSGYRAEYRIQHPDGSIRWITARGSPISDENGKPYRLVGVAFDITKQKEAEELILQQKMKMITSAKLSSLGEMAGGIAHEINNPLAIIHAKAEQLHDAAVSNRLNSAMIQALSNSIMSTSQRIAKIIRSMRAFSRDVESDPFQKVPVSQVIDDTLELCRERFRSHGIQVTVNLPTNPVLVECRPVQIAQVLLNLMNNAHDAVEHSTEKWVKIDVIDKDENVEIAVIDSGFGVPTHLQEKIFVPFFTTKEVGQGTGLGLSVSNGIITDHSGKIWIDVESRNTCFRFLLPKKQSDSKKAAA